MTKRLGDFLNVDVELTSPRQLRALVGEIEAGILQNRRTTNGWLLVFETDSYHGKSTPDSVIAKLCKLIKKLSPAGKRDWEAARCRVFNIGFESEPAKEEQNVVVRSTISEESLRRIVDLGAMIDITCYRHFDEIPTSR
jgi:hypothetical protein